MFVIVTNLLKFALLQCKLEIVDCLAAFFTTRFKYETEGNIYCDPQSNILCHREDYTRVQEVIKARLIVLL